jgi:beta-glucanase (GH16 family)
MNLVANVCTRNEHRHMRGLTLLVVSLGVAACGSESAAPAATSGAASGEASAGETAGGVGNAAGVAASGSAGELTLGGASAGSANVSNGGAASGGAANGGAAGSSIVAPAGYTLVWHDEFEVEGPPNPANYKFEQGFVRNEEAQWYQSANASVQGGMLVIEARKESVTNPKYTGTGDWKTTRKTADYTSASLNTSGLWSFQYGHFEMRARIPTSAGMWPAWWTLGVSGQWPSNGEIDIMEFYQSKLLANVACGTSAAYQAKWDSTTKALSLLGAGWSDQFHVWTMDWDAQNIVLSVDGQQLNTSSLSSMLNFDGTSPFKQKAYLLVNLAIGGQNGGDPSTTSFPQRYEIDYLRVFQKQ